MVRATVMDVRRQWQFTVQIAGIPPMLVTECTLPSPKMDEIKLPQGGANYAIKLPSGIVEWSDLVIKKAMLENAPDRFGWSWLQQAADCRSGVNLPATVVKKDGVILALNSVGAVVETYQVRGCWVKEIKMPEQRGEGKDLQIEELTIAVDRMDRLP